MKERVKQATMFGAEEKMDETEKVDLIVEVKLLSPNSGSSSLPRFVVTAAWWPRVWPGWGRGAPQCWWAASPPILRSPSPGTWWCGAALPWPEYTTTTTRTSTPRSRSGLYYLSTEPLKHFWAVSGQFTLQRAISQSGQPAPGHGEVSTSFSASENWKISESPSQVLIEICLFGGHYIFGQCKRKTNNDKVWDKQ